VRDTHWNLRTHNAQKLRPGWAQLDAVESYHRATTADPADNAGTGPAALAAGATLQASEGEQLLQCVSSVMARTRHGDEPAITDRLFYSHRNRFNRLWAADYLLSHPHRIKYFQLPKSGSKAIRAKMSEHFKAPAAYGSRFGIQRHNKASTWRHAK
jgi:hypothetical protein